MKNSTRFILVLAVTSAVLLQAAEKKTSPDDQYIPGPDSLEHKGVPMGTITKYSWNNSKIYPGTVRDYWVYVPAQYKADKPAPVFVC